LLALDGLPDGRPRAQSRPRLLHRLRCHLEGTGTATCVPVDAWGQPGEEAAWIVLYVHLPNRVSVRGGTMSGAGPLDVRFALMVVCAFLMGLLGTLASGHFPHAG
jgi:hypothetical protein